jgi:F-type H+-transporting ATPase subunit gamma
LLVIIASNRGLCGGFNIVLAGAVARFLEARGGAGKFDFVTVGRNAEFMARKFGGRTRGSFVDFSGELDIYSIGGLFRLVLDEFKSGAYNRVVIAYNNYVSAVKYQPVIRQILPVKPRIVRNIIEDIGKDDTEIFHSSGSDRSLYLFEPSDEEVLAEILPRLVEVQIYQAILESAASEHSARMVAMKNATDNAEEMVRQLRRGYNRARQDSITQEISEIATATGLTS